LQIGVHWRLLNHFAANALLVAALMMGFVLLSVPERDRARAAAALRGRATSLRFAQAHEVVELLRRPPPPDLLLLHAESCGDLTAPRLAKVRRHASPALKRLPVLVLVNDPVQALEWAQAGASTAKTSLSGGGLAKAAEEAIAAGTRWIDSLAYVGPDRRRKKALFNKEARRLEDSPLLSKEQARTAKSAEKIASVDVSQPLATLVRRLRIAGQSLALEDRDARARFLTDIRAARNQAVVAGRSSLARALGDLETTMAMAGANGPVDTHRIDALLYRAQEDVSA